MVSSSSEVSSPSSAFFCFCSSVFRTWDWIFSTFFRVSAASLSSISSTSSSISNSVSISSSMASSYSPLSTFSMIFSSFFSSFSMAFSTTLESSSDRYSFSSSMCSLTLTIFSLTSSWILTRRFSLATLISSSRSSGGVVSSGVGLSLSSIFSKFSFTVSGFSLMYFCQVFLNCFNAYRYCSVASLLSSISSAASMVYSASSSFSMMCCGSSKSRRYRSSSRLASAAALIS